MRKWYEKHKTTILIVLAAVNAVFLAFIFWQIWEFGKICGA